jgi:arginase
MGPSAFRAAGLGTALTDLGHTVLDRGNVAVGPVDELSHANPVIRHLGEVVAWTTRLEQVAFEASGEGMPIFLGGDHSLSAGTMSGISRRAAEEGREAFVLWLDSHPDMHTLETTCSGNLHGVPMAYATGRDGFAGVFPGPAVPLRPENVCMIGLRSVDPEERKVLRETPFVVHDMRSIDEDGIAAPLQRFLDRVRERDGLLHVSLDVDFLDPGIAPGVGTTVPGGATFREAHLVMEILHDAGLVRSIDLVASLMGRSVLDRPTRSF